jgi:hypothetical protein
MVTGDANERVGKVLRVACSDRSRTSPTISPAPSSTVSTGFSAASWKQT